MTIDEFSSRQIVKQGCDTSFIYWQLYREYLKKGSAVEVDFRSIVSWLKKGDQLTHQIHTYPAKLLPHIAHFFVNASEIYDDRRIVLDPFCGSGTVALEASLVGAIPYVSDANPLALLLTKVKTRPYEVCKLYAALQSIIKKAKKYRTAPRIDVVNHSLWYSSKIKSALERLLRSIREEPDNELRDFFLVAFSSVTRKLSYADPNISVPVRLREKPSFASEVNNRIRARLEWVNGASVFDEFEKNCLANIARIDETNKNFIRRSGAIKVGIDAKKLISPDGKGRLPNNSVSLVITSPPYGSAQKYIRASSLSLNWLEMAGPKDLSALEGRSIGREHVPAFREVLGEKSFLSENYIKLIEEVGGVNPTRAKITQKYLEEMDLVVEEMARVVSPGARAVFVVGNNQVCGKTLRNDEFLVERFLARGMDLELHLLDDIKSRGLMTKRNRTASIISRESVLVFKKRSTSDTAKS
ncbi:hypothetical protein ACP4J5_16335 [Pseudomonas oryzihabitans]|uniref:hypothetical protein n=1 Tax=Pseudomonas oryzihabitans TaxID=47885 RepID=UPI003CF982E7